MISRQPIFVAFVLFACSENSSSNHSSDDITSSTSSETGQGGSSTISSSSIGMGGSSSSNSLESTSNAGGNHTGGNNTAGNDQTERVPYGFWGLNGFHSVDGFTDITNRFNATVTQVASGNPKWTVETFLPIAREAGMKITLRLSGDHDVYTTNGNFDLSKWKNSLDAWKDSDIQTFIDDGTLIGHMILDDIGNWSWPDGGVDPTGDELDEMAQYSKSLMPGLMTFVRQRATEMPIPTGGTYTYLDACVNQYTILDGDIFDYAPAEREASLQLNLGIINGLNICDGGDGSSGQQGWRGTGFWAMSAEEISTYGETLLVDGMGMFLNWEYDGEEIWPDGTIGSDYFDTLEIQSALAELGTLVGNQPKVELLKSQ